MPGITGQGSEEVIPIASAYKLLVVDIDGTLLSKSGTISAEDREAITLAMRSGIKVSLCTGRVAQACRKIIAQLSLEGYHIFFDGALVANSHLNQEIYVCPIDKQLVKEVIDFAHLHEIDIDLYSPGQYFIEQETWASSIRRRFFGLDPTIVRFDDIWSTEPVIKGTHIVYSAEERAKNVSLRRHFQGRLNFSLTKTPAYPDVDFVNILARGVSKGRALEALTSCLGLNLDEVMAIGDGVNDIPLLSKVGLPVAMGNASPELKAIARYETLDVENSGVAAAIHRFLFEGVTAKAE